MNIMAILRISLTTLLMGIGMCFIFGEETAQDNTTFLVDFLVDKSLGIGFFAYAFWLYNGWKKADQEEEES